MIKKCQVCGNEIELYFTKDFKMKTLGKVEYVKCKSCGFVCSKTVCEMNEDKWNELNIEAHSSYQHKESNIVDPRWIQRLKNQSDIISVLEKEGVLNYSKGNWVDYGCGDGKLCDYIYDRNKLKIEKYDKYMGDSTYMTDKELKKGFFDVVITTSVFEHFCKIDKLDEVINLLSENGVLVLHTLVAEEIPKDPNWFYLEPVHVALYSNKSMEILFKRWGFECSLYHPNSQFWFFFKSKTIFEKSLLDSHSLFYKEGFMDYWKSSPYRHGTSSVNEYSVK